MQPDPTHNLANMYLQSDTTSSIEEYNIKLARFVRFCRLMQLGEQKDAQAAWAASDRKGRIQFFQMWIDNDEDIAAAFTEWQLQIRINNEYIAAAFTKWQLQIRINNDKDIGVHQTM